MKTKLSFLAPALLSRGLAPALCFGLVIALVFAACGGDSPNGSKSSNSNSGGYSSLGNIDVPGVVEIDGFDVVTEEKKVTIHGRACGTKDDPVVKVTYSISSPGKLGWISYGGAPLAGSISNESQCFDPRDGDSDVKIDLRNDDIPCGTDFYINLEAVNKSGVKASRDGKPFRRADSFCAMGNSSGVEISSSSIASWKFGGPTAGQAFGDTPYDIGSGKFTLLSGEGGTDVVDQPDLKITGGKIKLATPCNDQGTSAGPNGDVHPGEPYSGKETCLGNTPATDEKLSQVGGEGLGVQQGDYYLIYLDGGSIYLIFFTKVEGQSFSKWPIKYIYWPATEHP